MKYISQFVFTHTRQLLFCTIMSFIVWGLSVSAQSFYDVPDSHPASISIEYARRNHIVSGYADGGFQPESPVLRSELAKILSLGTGNGGTQCSNHYGFTDVRYDHWYAPFVHAGACRGWWSGYPDGRWNPGWYVNAAEATKMISLAFELPPIAPFDADAEEPIVAHEKLRPGTEWFAPYWRAVQLAGALPLSVADPSQRLTRAEMVQMIHPLHAQLVSPIAVDENANEDEVDLVERPTRDEMRESFGAPSRDTPVEEEGTEARYYDFNKKLEADKTLSEKEKLDAKNEYRSRYGLDPLNEDGTVPDSETEDEIELEEEEVEDSTEGEEEEEDVEDVTGEETTNEDAEEDNAA